MARQRLISSPACRLDELAADRLDLRGPIQVQRARRHPGSAWRGSPARPGIPGSARWYPARRGRRESVRARSRAGDQAHPRRDLLRSGGHQGGGNWAGIHPIRADHLPCINFSLPHSSKQPATRRNADQPACRCVNARSYVNSTGLLTAGVKPYGEPSLPHTSGMCDHTSEANR
jgi:hypothetical protein